MGGVGGVHSHFHVKPNRCVVLCWGWGFDNSMPRDVDSMSHLNRLKSRDLNRVISGKCGRISGYKAFKMRLMEQHLQISVIID